jgi:hypothetical protein
MFLCEENSLWQKVASSFSVSTNRYFIFSCGPRANEDCVSSLRSFVFYIQIFLQGSLARAFYESHSSLSRTACNWDTLTLLHQLGMCGVPFFLSRSHTSLVTVRWFCFFTFLYSHLSVYRWDENRAKIVQIDDFYRYFANFFNRLAINCST